MINIGIGVSWAKALYSVANNVIANFRARVLSYPNSIFEAGPCLDATLEELNAIGLLDNASLVITPNAYNEGILYDVIPNTTLGDMDVVRATTATRVNSAGLIEVVPRNLLTYSEQFENADWIKTNVTITANTTIAPNGSTTADTITSNSAAEAKLLQVKSAISSAVYTASLFVKKDNNETRFPEFYFRTESTTYNEIYMQLNTKTGASVIRFSVGTVSQSVESFGDYWRIKITLTNTSDNVIIFGIRPAATNVIGTYNPQIGSIIAWGAQLEAFPTATEYFPTTTRLNIPRIDYTNGSCPSLLVEPQRTNLLLQSNDLNATSWATVNISKTSGQVSPTSLNNEGWLLNKNALGVDGTIYNGFSIPALSNYTYSWYILKDNNESRFPEFYLRLNSGQVEQYVQMNTKTGSLAVRVASSGCTQSISSSPNNLWWRLTLTNPTPIANSGDNRHGVRPAAGTTLGVYNINATGSVTVYGAQTEQGSYATSYIPTVASTVTRNADIVSNSNLISKGLIVNDYTLVLDITNPILGNQYILDSRDISSVRTGILRVDGTTASVTDIGGGSSLSILNILTIGKGKMCLKRTGNVISFFANGVKCASTTTTTAGTINTLSTGVTNSTTGSYINSISLFPLALTDTECITLTTL